MPHVKGIAPISLFVFFIQAARGGSRLQNASGTLLLLTKYYPYGSGEAFLEHEIAYLADSFKRVLLIACQAPPHLGERRQVPANVTVCAIPGGSGRLRFASDVLRGIPRMFDKSAMISSEWGAAKGLTRKLFLAYFEEKSARAFREILRQGLLEELRGEPFTLYSYWFFSTAHIGAMIMDHLCGQQIRSLTRAHRYDLYEDSNRLNYLPGRRYLLERYDAVLPCSGDGARYLREKYPDCADKIYPYLLGTPDHGLGSSGDDGVFRIVSCSRVVPLKRVERIANALSLLERRGDIDAGDIAWTHIGDGPGLKKIKRTAARKLNKCVCVFAGSLKNEDVLSLYKYNAVDLFVSASAGEGLPVSVMEAVSFGIPTLAADVGGTREIVMDGQTGYLLRQDFEDVELADAIAIVMRLKGTSAYRALRESSRVIWENRFDARKNYRAFCDYMRNMW